MFIVQLILFCGCGPINLGSHAQGHGMFTVISASSEAIALKLSSRNCGFTLNFKILAINFFLSLAEAERSWPCGPVTDFYENMTLKSEINKLTESSDKAEDRKMLH
nr:hypothetical protein Iba_chr04bCG14380 [Ipomoea batatas]